MKKAVQSKPFSVQSSPKICATLPDSESVSFSVTKNSVRASGWVTFSDGSKTRLQATAKTRSLALQKWNEKASEARHEREYGISLSKGDVTIAEAVKALIDEYEICPRDGARGERMLTDSSIKRMRCSYAHQILGTSISSIRVHHLTVADVTRWKGELNRQINRMGKPLSASTKCRAFTLVQDVMKRHRPENDPCAVAKTWHQKTVKKTVNRILTPEEIRTVLSYCQALSENPKYKMDVCYADLTAVMLFIHCRPGECYGLQKRDWHSKEGQLDIHRTGKYSDGRLKTASSYREVFVAPQVADILNRRCIGLDPNAKIFGCVTAEIISDSNYRKFLKRTLKECGIDKEISPHALRGSGVSLALSLGIPVEIVSKNSGHASTSTTLNWYTEIFDETRRRAVEAYSVM